MDDGMDEIVQEFLVESYENLDQLDQDLVALESDPTAHSLLSSIFRTVHTIKGTSGFLGFENLEQVSHSGEGLLSELRDGKRVMDQPTTDVLLALVDTLRAILAKIESGEGDDAVAIDATVQQIRSVLDSGPASAAAGNPAGDEEPGEGAPGREEARPADKQVVARPAERPATASADEPGHQGLATAPDDPPATGTDKQLDTAPGTRNAAESSIRVDVDLLDALIRQVGELVLARNQVETVMASGGSTVEVARSTQRISLITSELQEGVMKTRMQPIDHIWTKMPRVVRDLSSQLGRQVRLTMVGGDTELDRSLLEAVKDPLTHIIRNAVDHGIESPQERAQAGKPEDGNITLRAYHAGGQVVVEVSDDGRGIDAAGVGRSAVKKGLRTPEQVEAMSTAELHELLFLPGFSTASKVTNVSGRGVGMDVVRTNVQGIGGSVDVDSAPGRGTTWRLRIPLTLAIMPALTVRCAEETFAISQVSILELVTANPEQIEHVGSAPVYRLRGALLPLVSLADMLGIGEAAPDTCVIAVLQAEDQRFGLLVDSVVTNEEIVVKAVSPRIKQIGIYSGATILGDGVVALILDVGAIARRALTGEVTEAVRARTAAEYADTSDGAQMLLVLDVGEGRHVAMPMETVTRLERMPASAVERLGRREVMQYRGELIPVVRLDQEGGAFTDAGEQDLAVVIASSGSAAIVVREVVDIVAGETTEAAGIDDAGLLGSAVIGNRVVEVLDVDQLLRPHLPARNDELVVAA